MIDDRTGEELSPEMTTFLKSIMSPWPDLSHIKALPRDQVETRSCIRCNHPVTGDRCDRCRARQATYRA